MRPPRGSCSSRRTGRSRRWRAAAVRSVSLTQDLFGASTMRAVAKDLMAMKVAELKEELEAREEGKSGNKAWLRRRLHGAILREHLEATGM